MDGFPCNARQVKGKKYHVVKSHNRLARCYDVTSFNIMMAFQGGHIPAMIKFPGFSLCYEFFPVFFFPKLIDGFE